VRRRAKKLKTTISWHPSQRVKMVALESDNGNVVK
jgi:hypothetical protein